LTVRVKRAIVESKFSEPLPISAEKDPLGLLFKGGSALAVSSIVKPVLLKLMAHQFALHFATYEMAKQAVITGGTAAATQFQNYVAIQTARRSMATSAARYGATRSVFSFLGPVLWTWFLADLGWRSISTNYARIIPTIFALAQIRLTRSECAWELA